MTARPFRFRPPAVESGPELRWVLAAAFADRPGACPIGRPDVALRFAERLGLLPRLSARAPVPGAGEPGATGSALDRRLAAERARGLALELRFEETLLRVREAAADVGTGLALLKGRALVAAGHSTPGSRPSGDVDLLVPPHRHDDLRRALVERGWAESADEHEHHTPSLSHPEAAPVELHRHLPGVRLTGRRSAAWSDLAEAGLLRRLSGPSNEASDLFVPAPDILRAHAMVHVLAQHGHHATYPGWWLIADLLDLRAHAGPDATRWREWIAGVLTTREIDGALELARRLASGGDPLSEAPESDPSRLARHFVAVALDETYRTALKAHWLEAPVSDLPRWRARLSLVVRALAPPPARIGGGAPEGPGRRALRWIARPFTLVRRRVGATLARRRLARAGRTGPPLF